MADDNDQGAETLRLRQLDLHWVIVDDEVVVLDGSDEVYLGTNATGALLWHALAAGATRAHLVNLLVDEFRLTSDRAGTDVDAFLGALADRALIETM